MARLPDKAFLNDRLTFRLDVLAAEAIGANDALFVEATGCTIREVRVLRLIDDYPGITFVEICRVTGLERSLTSRLIRHLLALGLIQREGTESDARRYRLSTTKLGKARRLTARALSDRLEAVLTRPLGKGELDSLKSMLDRLATWIRSEDYGKALADHRCRRRRTRGLASARPGKDGSKAAKHAKVRAKKERASAA